MTKDEALKLALEALESADWYINQLEITLYSADDAGTHEDRLKVQQAITVLRLEIDAQNMSSKYAAWEQFYPDIGKPQLAYLPPTESPENACYTPPAAQRQWVGLTDEDDIDWEDGGNLKDLVKAIEAKLKERNV
jgi:hypothetical protein